MATLEVKFIGSDETQTAVREVAGGIEDVGDAAETASEQGNSFFSGLLSSAGGFLAANVIGAISGQLAGFVGDAFEAARGTEKLMASTRQTIETMGNAAGRSAEEVADLASALSDASGKSLFGDDQIQQSENLLLTFGNIKGETFDLATALTVDLAAALGGAPKDQAMMLGKALNDPINGLTALGKAGLTFTEEQKATIAAMQEAGDMAGAQAIIIAELNKQVGGQAQAQAEAAGGMVQFQARLGEVGETVASALLPVIDELAGLLLDYLAPALETAAVWLGENLPVAIEYVKGVFATVSGVIDAVVGAFSGAGASSTELGGMLTQLGTIWQQIQEIISVAVELINATVVPIFTQIAGFLAAHSDEILGILQGVWTVIQGVIQVALSVIQGVISTVLAVIKGDWDGAWAAIQTMFSGVWDGIQQILSGALQIVQNELQIAWDAISGAVEGAWEGITSFITGAIDDIIQAFTTLPDQMTSIGDNIVAGLREGIESAWSSFQRWILDKAQSIIDDFLSTFDITSPSGVMADIGENIMLGLLQGLDDLMPDVNFWIGELTVAMLDGFQDLSEQAQQALQQQIDDLKAMAADLSGEVAAAVSDAMAAALDATASISRQKERNLAALDKFSADQQATIKEQLAAAEAAMADIEDPEAAERFFAQRSKHIFELASLQKQATEAGAAERLKIEADYKQQTDALDKESAELIRQLGAATTDEERQRLQEQITANDQARNKAREQYLEALRENHELAAAEQARLYERIALLQQAQEAEAAALQERQSQQSSAVQGLIDQLRDFMAALPDEVHGESSPFFDLFLQLSNMLSDLTGLNAPPATGGGPGPGGQGLVATGGGARPQTINNYTIDARGSTMRPEEFRRIIEEVTGGDSSRADIRLRTLGLR